MQPAERLLATYSLSKIEDTEIILMEALNRLIPITPIKWRNNNFVLSSMGTTKLEGRCDHNEKFQRVI